MSVYIHFGLIIDIHDDQSSFIYIPFSFARFKKLHETSEQKKRNEKNVFQSKEKTPTDRAQS